MRVFLCLALVVIALGCSPKPVVKAPGPLTIQTSVDVLEKLVTLPSKPVKAQWIHAPMGKEGAPIGPTDYSLSAVLDFSTADFEAIQAKLVALPTAGGEPFVLPGFGVVTGKAFRADAFAKSPLLHGRVLLPDTPAGVRNRIVLYLHTT